ncbi:hypothetical protein BaRGS_00030760, partial [Batillaria attramentaria]
APKFLNPHFNEITVESGHDAVEEFPVRTHTNEFSHCVITSDTHHNAGFMERSPIELAVIERRSVALEEEGSRQSAHFYMEVPDSPPPSDEDDAAEVAPPPVCHGPGNRPADYLNPEPSSDELEGEGTEWKTVPFYQNTQIRNITASGTPEDKSTPAALANNEPSTSGVSGSPQLVASASGNSSGHSDTADNTTEYVPYDPRLYENTSHESP